MKSTFFSIRQAYKEEWTDIMALAWKVFLKYEAPDYTPKGVQSFQEFITNNTIFRMFLAGSYQVMVAVEGEKIVGMIALRDNTHVSLLFVESKYHKMGIGKSLIEYAAHYLLSEIGAEKITVNASPYAVGFYHKIGFRDLGPEDECDGIRYTPMEFYL
jgi:ribosomal protein S18 acetylase RimI-like enzyme